MCSFRYQKERRADRTPPREFPAGKLIKILKGVVCLAGMGDYLPKIYLNRLMIALINAVINLNGIGKTLLNRYLKKYAILWKRAVSFPENEVPWSFPHNLQILFDSAFFIFFNHRFNLANFLIGQFIFLRKKLFHFFNILFVNLYSLLGKSIITRLVI